MPAQPRRIALVLIGGLLAALLLPPPPLAAQQPADLVISHVTVVDVEDGRLLADRDVLIRGDTIVAIRPASEVAPIADEVIDGRGGYLIPGLWDMHAHIRTSGVPAWISTDLFMPLLIANGVTGVRDMNSDCESPSQGPVCIEQMRSWQAAIAEGTLLGPRLLSLSSFQINPPWEFQMTAEQAEGALAMLAERGMDFLKVYTRMSPTTLQMVTATAERHGLRVAGHVPLRLTVAEASELGFWSVEHARDLLFDCFPGTTAFRASARSQTPTTDQMRAMIDQHDPATCRATFEVMVRNGTWYVPTHVTRRMDAMAHDSAFRNDPRNRFIPAVALDGWRRDADRMVASDPSPEGRRAFADFYRAGLAITGAAHRAGVWVLLGTDGGDTFVYPGSAVHDELGELVRAGLSPVEALRAATVRPAEFLGLTDRHGSVKVGRSADLVLLDADPLADIGAVRRIRAVIFRGEHLDRARLDGMLAGVEKTAQRPLGPASGQ
jgi:cytosine/adenosine deaminase-related metal-dependent hydrolase